MYNIKLIKKPHPIPSQVKKKKRKEKKRKGDRKSVV